MLIFGVLLLKITFDYFNVQDTHSVVCFGLGVLHSVTIHDVCVSVNSSLSPLMSFTSS